MNSKKKTTTQTPRENEIIIDKTFAAKLHLFFFLLGMIRGSLAMGFVLMIVLISHM